MKFFRIYLFKLKLMMLEYILKIFLVFFFNWKESFEDDNDIAIFEKFYKMNNSLKYCNGSYYKFNDIEWQDKYNDWLKTDDYKSKSFNLYYGNGVVD